MINKRINIKSKVKEIISEIAHIPMVELSDNENLIEIGADSIILAEVNSHIRDEFGVEIPVTNYFEQLTTVEAIAAYILEKADDYPQGLPDSEKPIERQQEREYKSPKIDIPTNTVNSKMIDLDLETPLADLSSHPSLIDLFAKQIEIINNQINFLKGKQFIEKNVIKRVPVVEDIKLKEDDYAFQQLDIRNTDKDAQKIDAYVPFQKLDFNNVNRSAQQEALLKRIISEYNLKTASSKEYAAKYRYPYADCRSAAGFRPNIKEMVYQLIFKNSEGAYITDIDDNKYIDLAMDFGVSLFGHKPKFIQEALKSELETGFPLSLVSGLSGEVAEIFCSLTGFDRMSFYNSGTEAVMVSIRLARAATGRNKIITFSGSYHGTFDGVLGMYSRVNDNYMAKPLTIGIAQSLVDDLIVLEYDKEESLNYIQLHSKEIAAVLVEPIQSRRPEVQPREFLHELRKITKQEKIVLIFDEMILGFRLGKGGAQEYFGVRADLATYGKIVGGGLPIGIVAGLEEIMNGIDGGVWNYGDASIPPYEDKRTFVAGTFCHHPLTMAAAKAVLSYIKSMDLTVYKELNMRTEYLAITLNNYFEKKGIPIHITYCGSLFRFVLKGNLELFYYMLILKGIYIWEGRNCFISTAHTDEDIDYIIKSVKAVCEELRCFFHKSEVSSENNDNLKLNQSLTQILAFQLMNSESNSLQENLLLEVKGSFNTTVLKKACRLVMERHEACRYTLSEDYSSFVIQSNLSEPVESIEYEESYHEIIEKLSCKKDDLLLGPLFHIYCICSKNIPDITIILITANHLIMDGWSISVLYQEIVEVYNSIMQMSTINLLQALSYSGYLAEMMDNKGKRNQNELVDNLYSCYEDADCLVDLPCRTSEGIINDNQGRRIQIYKEKDLIDNVRKAATYYKCSPFLVYVTAFQLLLRTITGQQTFTIGVPIAGQKYYMSKSIIGNCALVRPLTCNIDSFIKVSDLFSNNKDVLKRIDELYNALPEEYIQNHSGFTANVLFNMDRIPKMSEFFNTNVKPIVTPINSVSYDLFFNLCEFDGNMIFDIDYNSVKFSEKMVMRWVDAYFDILNQFIETADQQVVDFHVYCEKDEEIRSQVNNVTDRGELEQILGKKLSSYSVENDNFYLSVRSREFTPIITDSYGYLYLGENELCSFNTGWIARLTNDCKLDIFGPKNRIVRRKNKTISLWMLETSIKKCHLVTYCRSIYLADTDELIVFLDVTNRNDNEILCWINENIIAELRPDKIYYSPDHSNTMDGSRLIDCSFKTRSKTEDEVFRLILDVTGRNNFSVDNNLFAQGISSLQLLKLLAKLQETFAGVRISINDLISNSSILLIAKMIEQKKEYSIPSLPMKKAQTNTIYPTSAVQKRIYYLTKLNPLGTEYNVVSSIRISGSINYDTFINAYNKCISKYEILRAVFQQGDNDIIYKIKELCPATNEAIKFFNTQERDLCIENELKSFIRPFNLESEPLYRMEILSFSSDYHVILMDFHHIIFDGTSSLIFADEMMRAYTGEEPTIDEYDYKDYTLWQEELFQSEQYQNSLAYWNSVFESPGSVNDLLIDYSRNVSRSYESKVIKETIDNTLKDMIEDYAIKNSCTPFSVFIAALTIVLHLYMKEEDITIGTVIEGRNDYTLQKMIGMFVNTLPIRNKITMEKNISEFVREVNDNCFEAYKNSDVPFDEIVKISEFTSSRNRNPLFDVEISYQDYNMVKNKTIGDLCIEFEEILTNSARFDIEIIIKNHQNNFGIEICYAKELFQDEKIYHLLGTFVNVLNNMVKMQDARIVDICKLSNKEEEEVLNLCRGEVREYAANKTIIDLFEEQVEIRPDNIAVIDDMNRITYRQLNNRVNALAIKLRELGVYPDDFVAIISERSIDMIIGIFAIIKAGGAYVPIDPTYPRDRIEYMLDDCKAKVILFGDNDYCKYIPVTSNGKDERNVLFIKDWITQNDIDNPKHIVGPDNLVYVIYTSGTTGRPKGVMNCHKGLLNRILWMNERYPLGENGVILQKSTYTFDVSVWELIWWSLVGAKVVMLQPGGEKDPEEIVNAISQYNVTNIHFVPSMLKMFLDYCMGRLERNPSIQSLRYVFSSGEELKKDTLRQFNQIIRSKYADIKLINLYGPTEASIDVTYFDCEDNEELIPIGKPITNTQTYIVNGNNLCGIGMPGELCIAGVGLAKGYLNKLELTKEKFTPNLYGEGMMYRSGDLAKLLFDGNIQYLGRIDEQVKIRGFRIEIGEIECAIREIECVKDATVIAREDKNGDKMLYAYFVSDIPLEVESVKKQLSSKLAIYMLPSYIMQIDKIPVTKNGKLDKKALPEIQTKTISQYEAPSNEVEQQLVIILENLLDITPIGVKENFLELGGDSIKALRLLSRLRESGYELSVKDLMEAQDIRHIAAKVKKLEEQYFTEQEEIIGDIPLSPIQMNFYSWDFVNKNYFNQAIMCRCEIRLDINELSKAISAVVIHHDMLRAQFIKQNQTLRGIEISKQIDIQEIDYTDIDEEVNLAERIEERNNLLHSSLNIEEGKIIKAIIYHTKSFDHLFICIHHLVVDAVSYHIIMEDIFTSYRQLLSNNKVQLPKKTASYKQWVETLNEYTDTKVYKEEITYWMNKAYHIKDAKLPGDIGDDIQQCQEASRSCIFKLNESITNQLLYKTNFAFHTEVMDLLLVAFVLALRNFTYKNTIAVDLEGHGREELHKQLDVTRTVGWFTSIYPVILEASPSIKETIIHTKDMLRRIPKHGIGFNIAKYYGKISLPDDKPDICFNYLGEIGNEVNNGFTLSEFPIGNDSDNCNQIPYNMIVDCKVLNKEFNIQINYDTGRYSDRFISGLSDNFISSIHDVVKYCMEQKESEKTISDLTSLDLSADTLLELSEMF